jgi:hypothetical protein
MKEGFTIGELARRCTETDIRREIAKASSGKALRADLHGAANRGSVLALEGDVLGPAKRQAFPYTHHGATPRRRAHRGG